MAKSPITFNGLLPENFERRLRDFRDVYFRRYKIVKLPSEIFEPSVEKKSISFCTTCMNRFFHLRKTIIPNIESNLKYPNVEFVLVNYNSQDELHEWALKNLKRYIDIGILNYFHTKEPQFFHVCKAKNLAHKAARSEIVCNLDGDNFTGADFAFYINFLYNKYGSNSILHFRKDPFWGTEGRIALNKSKFMELGGYDETFLPTGHEDYDLLNRAKAYGMQYQNIQIENFLKYLSNTTKEKSKNFEDPNAYYYDFESRNRDTSNSNIANNLLIANPNGFGLLPVYKNFTEELIYL